MADNLARFRALQSNSNPQMFNSDTTSGAIEGNAQAIESQREQIEAYLASVRKAQEQSQPSEPNMTVDGTTEAPSYDFSTPVAGESAVAGNVPRVTQSFGNRSSVEAYSKGVNLGTDFGVKKGTPLALPPGEWEVMTTFSGAKEGQRGANSGSGNLVKVVNTKTGEMLAFEHLSGVGVRPGQTINGGTVIGLSGNTGNSTGPHASIPYQDAQGKYHDVLSSPYAKYIFGQVNGSTSGKGGGKMADIGAKALDFIKNIPSAISNGLIYNQETKRPFPNSPYWGITDANAITDPIERQKSLTNVSMNAVMALSAAPKSVGNLSNLTPGSALDQSMEILRNKQSTADMAHEAELMLTKLGEQYGIKGSSPISLGTKLQKVMSNVETTQSVSAREKTIQNMLDSMDNALSRNKVNDIPRIKVDTTTPVKPLSVEPTGEIPKTVKVWNKSKFSNDGAYVDIPVIRKEENITLYQGGKDGDGRQFWTPDKKYAEQFGNVKKKTGSFYKVDNGNRVTDVYVEAKPLSVEPVGGETLKNVSELPKNYQEDLGSVIADQVYKDSQYMPSYDIPKNLDAKVKIYEADPNQIKKMFGKTRDTSPVAVSKYAEDMLNGADFPPVYVANGKFIDGGHRVEAAIKAGVPVKVADITDVLNDAVRLGKDEEYSTVLDILSPSPLGGKVVAQGGLSDVIKKQLSKYKK